MIARLQLLAADWAERRQGADPLGVMLRRRRIYILPTRFGAVFGGLVLAMLLGSLNYDASLGFALTFLLAGLGLVVMHHCHNNLLGLTLHFAGARPVFAGQTAEFRIQIDNGTDLPRRELELDRGGHTSGPTDLEAGASTILTAAVPTEQRGWLSLGRFVLVTRHPGALFRAWTWVNMEARCLVYPAPAPPGRPLPEGAAGDSARTRPVRGDADFAGLRSAERGDPPGRIAWKAYARSDELLLKLFSSGEAQPLALDWDTLPELGTEARLSQLARWCLDAAESLQSFSLTLPGTRIALGNGDRHLHECLRALALFEAGPKP